MCCSPVGLDGVAVLTLLLGLALVQLSGCDLVFQGFLIFSVLHLSLVLDPILVVDLSLVPVLVLELFLVHLAFGLCLALVSSWILALSLLVAVPILSWALAWPSWC